MGLLKLALPSPVTMPSLSLVPEVALALSLFPNGIGVAMVNGIVVVVFMVSDLCIVCVSGIVVAIVLCVLLLWVVVLLVVMLWVGHWCCS